MIDFPRQAQRRRRRIGVSLLLAVVTLIAGQSFVEWLLPYDMFALERVRAATGWPGLTPQILSLVWALFCLMTLWPLRQAGTSWRWAVLAALAGVFLGSARLAAGGAVPAVMLLLAAGVASLGWQSLQGGLALLLGTALAIVAWDVTLSSHATLWPVCIALVAVFVWIERQHIQATDQRLFAALTEREALIRDLRLKREQLLALQHARTHLLAGIGHDLRQPLWAMRLCADAMLAREPAADEASLLRQQILATEDAIGMLDQFSDFAAIERGALKSHPERVNVRQVIELIAAVARSSHHELPIEIAVHGRDTWIRTDRTQLTRVIRNLLSNAVRHSLAAASESRPARVLLAVRPHSEGYSVDVIDNGDGIPPDQLELVFEPYVQLEGGRRRGSQGLGLAIVRGLTAQLAMVLAPVRSELGRGTRFRVLVPRTLQWCGEPQDSTGLASSFAGRAALTGRLVAVLDDETNTRQALVTALQSAGAECVDAGRLDELVARVDEQVRFPDALVFDLDLGTDVDGLAAIEQLRRAWRSNVPALLVTGRPHAELTLPPACSLLSKPVSLGDMVEALVTLERRAVPEVFEA